MDDDFKDRVIAERTQLAEKILKLRQFIQNPLGSEVSGFESLPLDERRRLSTQLSAMGVYKDVLDARIGSDFK